MPGKREEDSLLNCTNIIRNNLVKPNNTNLERQRTGMAGCSADDESKLCIKYFMKELHIHHDGS